MVHVDPLGKHKGIVSIQVLCRIQEHVADGGRDPANVLILVPARHFLQTGKNFFLAQVEGRFFENIQRDRAGIPVRVLANRVCNDRFSTFLLVQQERGIGVAHEHGRIVERSAIFGADFFEIFVFCHHFVEQGFRRDDLLIPFRLCPVFQLERQQKLLC